MSSLIDNKTPSMFDPARRFAFTNITDEDLVSAWDGSPIIVKPGVTVELPHHLANKLTDELVDKIMIGNVKMEELAKNEPYYRSPNGSNLGVPAARKVWEDKIVRELEVDEESPEIQIIRAQVRAEVLADMSQENAKPAETISVNKGEFADLNAPAAAAKPKPAVRVKTISPDATKAEL